MLQMLLTLQQQFSPSIAFRFQSALAGLALGLGLEKGADRGDLRSSNLDRTASSATSLWNTIAQGIDAVTGLRLVLPDPAIVWGESDFFPLHYLPWICVLAGDGSCQDPLLKTVLNRGGDSNPQDAIVFLLQVWEMYLQAPPRSSTPEFSQKISQKNFPEFSPPPIRDSHPRVQQAWTILHQCRQQHPTLSQGLEQWNILTENLDSYALGIALWLTLRSDGHFPLSLAQVPSVCSACATELPSLQRKLWAYTGLLAGFVTAKIPWDYLPPTERSRLQAQGDRLFRAWAGRDLMTLNRVST